MIKNLPYYFIFLLVLATYKSLWPQTANKIDYQKLADLTPFTWSSQKASILHSLLEYSGPGEIYIIRDPQKHGYLLSRRALLLRIRRDNKIVFSQVVHEGQVFKGVKDVIYYADFVVFDNGCAVVAYDLKQKKQLWRTSLQGVGLVTHSDYRNWGVNLEVDDQAVMVQGHEQGGDYIEYLEVKSGKTLGHRRFKRKPPHDR